MARPIPWSGPGRSAATPADQTQRPPRPDKPGRGRARPVSGRRVRSRQDPARQARALQRNDAMRGIPARQDWCLPRHRRPPATGSPSDAAWRLVVRQKVQAASGVQCRGDSDKPNAPCRTGQRLGCAGCREKKEGNRRFPRLQQNAAPQGPPPSSAPSGDGLCRRGPRPSGLDFAVAGPPSCPRREAAQEGETRRWRGSPSRPAPIVKGDHAGRDRQITREVSP